MMTTLAIVLFVVVLLVIIVVNLRTIKLLNFSNGFNVMVAGERKKTINIQGHNIEITIFFYMSDAKKAYKYFDGKYSDIITAYYGEINNHFLKASALSESFNIKEVSEEQKRLFHSFVYELLSQKYYGNGVQFSVKSTEFID